MCHGGHGGHNGHGGHGDVCGYIAKNIWLYSQLKTKKLDANIAIKPFSSRLMRQSDFLKTPLPADFHLLDS